MAPRDRRVLAVLGLSAWLSACGPIEYVNQVTFRADSAVEAARAANAEKLAPYWWTRATEYLHQARVEAASADFQAANRFGRLATEAAARAREESLRAAQAPEAVEPPPAPPRKKDNGMAPAIEDGDDATDDETPPAPRGTP